MSERQAPSALVLSACLVALLVAGANAGDVVGGLRVRRDLVVPPRSADDLVAVRVDGIVADGCAERFADLRVIDSGGREVPFVLRTDSVVTQRVVRTMFPLGGIDLEPRDDGGLVITFTVDPVRHPAPVGGFRIVTPLVNFEQRVRLERRQADGGWKALVEEGLLCDYTQWMDVRNAEIPVPDAWRRAPGGTFRITVDDATAEQRSQVTEVARTLAAGVETGVEERFRLVRQPFRIDRIDAWSDETVTDRHAAEPVSRAVESWTVVEDPETKVTRIGLGSAGGPVTALRLGLADRNIARAVTVTVPPPPAEPGRRPLPPPVVGSGRIERLDLRGLQREQLTVPLHTAVWAGRGQARTALEIVIANGDSPPPQITGVEALGPAYAAVFIARPGETYRLAHGVADGAASPPPPHYDTAAIEAALAAGRLPTLVALGAAAEVAVAEPVAEWKAVSTDPWLLGAMIVVLAMALVVALIQAARRIERLPDGDEDRPGDGAGSERR